MAELGTEVGAAYVIPKSQRFAYKIAPLPGQLMSAASVGRQIEALAEVLIAIAEKDDPGRPWNVCLTRIITNCDGSLEFDLAILPKSEAQPE